MVENFDKMLAGSLRPEDPWYIIGAEFNEEEPAIHIHVGIDKTAALCCPVCGAPTKRYGYEPKERIRHHADCLFCSENNFSTSFGVEPKIPPEADVIVVHEKLADRVGMAVQGKRIITIQNYLDDPAIRALQEEIAKQYGKA